MIALGTRIRFLRLTRMTYMIKFISTGLLFLLNLYVENVFAGDWLAWRGNNYDGIGQATNLPIEWNEEKGVLWKLPLPGTGYSTPIVIGDQLILTTSDGLDYTELSVLSIDAMSGELRWRTRFFGSRLPFLSQFAKELGTAIPSCVSDGRTIIAKFSTGEICCLDLDGAPIWFRSLGVDYVPFTNDYGAASSPVIADGKVFVVVDQDGSSYVLALSLETGETIWKKDRPECGDNWATPFVFQCPRTKTLCLLCSGSYQLECLDAANGETMWIQPGAARLCAPTPFLFEDKLISTSGPGGQTLAVSTDSKAPTDRLVWKSQKGTGFLPSAILSRDYYLHSGDRGILTILSARTGEEITQKRIGGSYRASPVMADGKVFFVSLEGDATVVDSQTFEILGVSSFHERVGASPAIAHDSLYIRGEKHLFRIGTNDWR